MKSLVCLGLIVVSFYSLSSRADQDMSICDANPSAPQCVQARAAIPDSLPERYSLTSLIENAVQSIHHRYEYKVAGQNCFYVNSAHVAYRCAIVTTAGRTCTVNLLQIWENADYQIGCSGKRSYRKMVNPGPVPPTMD